MIPPNYHHSSNDLGLAESKAEAKMKSFVVFLSVVAYVSCGPVSSEDSVLRSVIGNFVNCNSDLGLCMKVWSDSEYS